jgi:hypothetical protein
VKPADALAELMPFDPGSYADIDLDRLTSYGIKALMDRKVPATFENIVVALYRLFPEKFSLIGHREYPDAARVNRALLHGQPKYRNYVAGGARQGYSLTNQGLGAAEETEKLLRSSRHPLEGRRKKPSAPRAVADQFMREVSEAGSFRSFSEGRVDEVGEYDLYRILHAGPGTPVPDLIRRLEQLLAYAEQMERNDVYQFLNWLRTRFLSNVESRPWVKSHGI